MKLARINVVNFYCTTSTYKIANAVYTIIPQFLGLPEDIKKKIKDLSSPSSFHSEAFFSPAFQKNYPTALLRVYSKIRKKLGYNESGEKRNSGKIITVSFRQTSFGEQTIDNSGLAAHVIHITDKFEKEDPDKFLNYLYKDWHVSEKNVYLWFEKNNLKWEDFKNKKLSREEIKKFIVDNMNFSRVYNYSETEHGIQTRHAYLVLDAFEHEGSKYIVLKNPCNVKTKINYKKDPCLPKEVKLPEQIDKLGNNECMMELTHFCKLLFSIDYDTTPKELGKK